LLNVPSPIFLLLYSTFMYLMNMAIVSIHSCGDFCYFTDCTSSSKFFVQYYVEIWSIFAFTSNWWNDMCTMYLQIRLWFSHFRLNHWSYSSFISIQLNLESIYCFRRQPIFQLTKYTSLSNYLCCHIPKFPTVLTCLSSFWVIFLLRFEYFNPEKFKNDHWIFLHSIFVNSLTVENEPFHQFHFPTKFMTLITINFILNLLCYLYFTFQSNLWFWL